MSQTIFVLEDDADISRLVQYHLESAGFTVSPIWRLIRYFPMPNGSLRRFFSGHHGVRAATVWTCAGGCVRILR